MEISEARKAINPKEVHGTILVIGGPGVGKSTFAKTLYEQLRAEDRRVAFLDGDPGQSTLGPPTSMTLSMHGDEKSFPPQGATWRWFVGSTSPAGHMLPLIVGVSRLVGRAKDSGADVVIYDTTGLVGPAMGGDHLKMAKIDLLKPSLVFVIQREDELKGLLLPLKRSSRTKVLEINSPALARRREAEERQRYRAGKYRSYFKDGIHLTLHWPSFAVLARPAFETHRLVALEDGQGFMLGLGIVHRENRQRDEVTLVTPLRSTDGIDAIRIGDVRMNPNTFRDQRI
jgi:polynucleotide 5'-hydroxyl-kinase GRC3/NOL9